MDLADLIEPDRVVFAVRASDKQQLLQDLASRAATLLNLDGRHPLDGPYDDDLPDEAGGRYVGAQELARFARLEQQVRDSDNECGRLGYPTPRCTVQIESAREEAAQLRERSFEERAGSKRFRSTSSARQFAPIREPGFNLRDRTNTNDTLRQLPHGEVQNHFVASDGSHDSRN